MLDRAAWHELKLTVDGADSQGLARRQARPRVHARQRARPGPQQRAAESRICFPANNPVLRPPVTGKVGLWAKTDTHQLLQGLRGEPEMKTLMCPMLRFVSLACARRVLRPRARAVAQHRRTIVVLVTDQTGARGHRREGHGHQHADRRPARGAVRQRRQRHVSGAVADRHLHGQRVEAGLRQPKSATTSRCAPARPRRCG